jgi:hypothetical protein
VRDVDELFKKAKADADSEWTGFTSSLHAAIRWGLFYCFVAFALITWLVFAIVWIVRYV